MNKDKIEQSPDMPTQISLIGLQKSDIAMIMRRRSVTLCGERIAADMRQLADEIEQLSATHSNTIQKIRECVNIPKHVGFVN